jgi:hypothetical protein
MSWEAIAAVGEIIGAAAVVVSLVSLGRQVREGARAELASTEMEAARMWSEFHARVAHSPDMARIWDMAHTDHDRLDPAERQRFIWLIAEYFFLVEGLWKQHGRGFLSDDSLRQHAATAIGVLGNPVVREWWASDVSPFSSEFRAFLNTLVDQGIDEEWRYTPLAEFGSAVAGNS